MSENVRIRIAGDRMEPTTAEESMHLVHDDNKAKVKQQRYGPLVIVVALLVGAAVLTTVLVLKSTTSTSTSETDYGDLETSIKSLDYRRLQTDQSYRMDVIREILRQVPLIDGHNDLPYLIRQHVDTQISQVDLRSDLTKIWNPSHTDIPRLRNGMVGGQFWSVYVGCEAQYRDAVLNALVQADMVKSMVLRYPDVFQIVTDSSGIWEAHKKGRIASLLGVEGGHMIGEHLGVLRQLYDLGARYLTLTHNCHTPWADSCYSYFSNTPKNNGLTDWGKRVVREMNRIGMIVDISHVSAEVMRDVLDNTIAPVMFSHSSAYSICPHKRNVPDDVLRRMKDNGGIVMVNFNPPFVNCTLENRGDSAPRTATMEQVADHIEYIRDTAGVDHVGLGGDFDGITSVPDGLEDVSKYPNLLTELLRRGWDVQSIAKLAGNNIIRVFEGVEQTRNTLSDLLPDDTAFDYELIPDKSCISAGGFDVLQNSYDQGDEASSN